MSTTTPTEKKPKKKRGTTIYKGPLDLLTGGEPKQQLRRGRPASHVDSVRVNYRLPRQLVADLKGEAQHQNLGISALLAMILIDYFAGRTTRKPRQKETAAKTVAEYAKEKGVLL